MAGTLPSDGRWRNLAARERLGVILLLLFFAVVLVPLFGATIIAILALVAIILISAVIFGNRGI